MSAKPRFVRKEGGEYAYAIESTKIKFGVGVIRELGWEAKTSLRNGLEKTIRWYKNAKR